MNLTVENIKCRGNSCMCISTYDPSTGYVSLRKSSLEKVENYLPNFEPIEGYLKHCAKTIDVQLTARDIVLKRCGQTDALDFKECYPSR